jgi:DNA repair protein RadC
MYKYKKLKDIPEEHRPREKLKKLGAKALSDEELLAVVFGSGTKGMDVLSLARSVLRLGWKKLEDMNFEELTRIRGLGTVKAMQLIALIELSKRIREPYGGERIQTPEDAYNLPKLPCPF